MVMFMHDVAHVVAAHARCFAHVYGVARVYDVEKVYDVAHV